MPLPSAALTPAPSFPELQLSDPAILVLTWLAVAAHLAIGIAVVRRASLFPLIPLVNLASGLCVLGYWAQRWYGYLAHGITWYLTDQLVPLYAIVICVIAAAALAGRSSATLPHWLIFGIDGLVVLAAALFFTFFRLDRLL